MKKSSLFLGLAALAAAATVSFNSCNSGKASKGVDNADSTAVSTAAAGSIVFVNLDEIIAGYDMANELNTSVQSKIKSISDEVNRRGNKLQSDVNDFQDKINKGLITRSTAEVQANQLQKRQDDFNNYANQKQQEAAEEQQVALNQIEDAIKQFLDKYNEEKHYALILTTQGDLLPTPVVACDSSLDITKDVIRGLNEEYVKTKASGSSSASAKPEN
jgi:outer membrane protein